MGLATRGLRRFSSKSLVVGWIVVGLVAAVSFQVTGLSTPIERVLSDASARSIADAESLSSEVLILEIDGVALNYISSQDESSGWPWPRYVYRQLIEAVRASGARVVTLALEFTEYDCRTVRWDLELAAAMSDAGCVVLPIRLGEGSSFEWPDRAPLPPRIEGVTSWVSRAGAGEEPVQAATFPIRELAGTAAGLGFLTATTDSDKRLREALVLQRFDDSLVVPSLALQAILVAGSDVRVVDDGGTLLVDGRRIPLSRSGTVPLRFKERHLERRRMSAEIPLRRWREFKSGRVREWDKDWLKARHVVIGPRHSGQAVVSTPARASTTWSLYHATVIDNLTAGKWNRNVPGIAHWAGVTVLTMLAVLAAVQMPSIHLAVAGCGLVVLASGAIAWVAASAGMVVPFAPGLVASLASGTGAVLHRAVWERRLRRFLDRAIGLYVSPRVVEEIKASPELLAPGGRSARVSVLFIDIEGFTGLADGAIPENVAFFLNTLFEDLAEVIGRGGGTLDKFIGDAVLAFWGAPVPGPGDEEAAVRAALGCLEQVARHQARYSGALPGSPRIRLRCGIASGAAIVGNLGARSRFDYTVIGSPVNLASRLEAANKVLRTSLLIDAESAHKVRATVSLRELGRLELAGVSQPTLAFEPAALSALNDEDLARYAEALASLRNHSHREAEVLLQHLAPRDPVSRSLLESIHRALEEGREPDDVIAIRTK